MDSRSFRQKSASSIPGELAARLLQDGALLPNPSAELISAAEWMESKGLIATRVREHVLCANPLDRDFPPRVRTCRGRLYLDQGLDEAGHEFRCPECDRPIFPYQHQKQKHKELRVRTNCQGIIAYVLSHLAELEANTREISKGVFRIDIGSVGVLLCIADFCTEEKYLTLDWARTQPTCYLAVNSQSMADRFLEEDWIRRIPLADLVSGKVNLRDEVNGAATMGNPLRVCNASVPVYARGPMPIVVEAVSVQVPGRHFTVECGPESVRVEGELVIPKSAGSRYLIFRILWERFLGDMAKTMAPAEHNLMSLEEIVKEVEIRCRKYIEDETAIRRYINRLQTDIETTVKKKIGLPIDREDIIQTCRWKGQKEGEFGYRINPFTVTARPYQND